MKKITPEILRSIMPLSKEAARVTYADLINQYAAQFGLKTDIQMAHYLAQIAHESGELRYTEEIASGKAYDTGSLAIKLGNTPIADGDGQKYKGRGLIQLTGYNNYKAYSDYLVGTGMKVDLTKTPELLAKPLGALKSSMWFCMRFLVFNKAAKDNGTVTTVTVKDAGVAKKVTVNQTLLNITRTINGGCNGIVQRQRYFDKAKLILGV